MYLHIILVGSVCQHVEAVVRFDELLYFLKVELLKLWTRLLFGAKRQILDIIWVHEGDAVLFSRSVKIERQLLRFGVFTENVDIGFELEKDEQFKIELRECIAGLLLFELRS